MPAAGIGKLQMRDHESDALPVPEVVYQMVAFGIYCVSAFENGPKIELLLKSVPEPSLFAPLRRRPATRPDPARFDADGNRGDHRIEDHPAGSTRNNPVSLRK